jgi:hypothetical protein
MLYIHPDSVRAVRPAMSGGFITELKLLQTTDFLIYTLIYSSFRHQIITVLFPLPEMNSILHIPAVQEKT